VFALPVHRNIANSKAAYEGVADEIHRLRELRQNTMEHNVERQTQRQRIAEMTEFLQGQSSVIIEYDDKLVRRLVEKVTVFDEMLKWSLSRELELILKYSFAKYNRRLRCWMQLNRRFLS